MSPELEALIEKAKGHVMTEEEIAAQRASFVRAMMPAGYGMTTEQIQMRIIHIDQQIANTSCWGALLSELREERDELVAELSKRGF